MIELSVIVATQTRPRDLERALRSLSAQTLPAERFEVLVVDNGTDEATPAVAQEAARRLRHLRYVRVEPPGLHAARHRGAREAAGRVLVFTDDDVEAAPTWLAGVAEGLARSDAVLLGGPIHPVFEDTPPAWLRKAWADRPPGSRRMIPALSLLDLGPGDRRVSPFLVWGCNLAIRREVLEEARGFHPDAMPPNLRLWRGDGETWLSEFVAGRYGPALYRPDARVLHRVPRERMTLAYWAQRAYQEGVSDSYTLLRNRLRQGACGPEKPCRTAAHRKRMASILARGLAKRILAAIPWPLTSGAAARIAAARASRRGYRDHRRAVARDPRLADWVARDDYWDASPPRP